MLSIITVCFNNLEGLKRTYRSLAPFKTSDRLEWVVVDGHSNDGTKEFLQEVTEFVNFKFISEPDTGIFDAMNKGIEMSKMKYLLFLNSGDFLNISDFSKISFERFEDINVFNIKPVYIDLKPVNWKGLNPNLIRLKKHNSIPHQSTIIHRRCFVGRIYNTNFKYAGDYDLFCWYYTNSFKFKFFSETILSVFVYDGISSNFRNSLILLKERARIQKYYFDKIDTEYYLIYIIRFILSRLPLSEGLVRLLRSILFGN